MSSFRRHIDISLSFKQKEKKKSKDVKIARSLVTLSEVKERKTIVVTAVSFHP
jgi:hypothetical protein